MTGSNIIPQKHFLRRKNRNAFLKNRSMVIWFTGLSGSGKSTLANNLEQRLFKENILSYILDGDNIRAGLNKDLGFDELSRKENIRRISEVSKLMVDAGIVVITAFISPFEKEREESRKLIGKKDFIEIFVSCPLNLCIKRDVKGLYAKANKGEIKNFTGIDSQYQIPVNPHLLIDTSKNTIKECTEKIYNFVIKRILFQS